MTSLPTYKGIVQQWHCDHMGHMNVMWYVGKFDEATWAFFARVGLIPAELRAQDRGMAALDQHLVYKREALPGDLLEIHTRPLVIKDKTIRFIHTMTDCQTGEVSATCELVAAHLDKIARKAIVFPDEVREKAAAMIAAG